MSMPVCVVIDIHTCIWLSYILFYIFTILYFYGTKVDFLLPLLHLPVPLPFFLFLLLNHQLVALHTLFLPFCVHPTYFGMTFLSSFFPPISFVLLSFTSTFLYISSNIPSFYCLVCLFLVLLLFLLFHPVTYLSISFCLLSLYSFSYFLKYFLLFLSSCICLFLVLLPFVSFCDLPIYLLLPSFT